jgi:cytochrome c5
VRRIIIWGSCLTLFLFSPFISANVCGPLKDPMSQEAILERIKSVGEVNLEEGAEAPKPKGEVEALAADAGEKRYKATCALCHEPNVAKSMGSPAFRNAADWKPRMAVGIDGMLQIAITGKGAMPPRGTCMQCSDQELKMAIEYMLPK